MVRKKMMWKVVLMMGMVAAAVTQPVLGVLNNGFETDYVYYIKWDSGTAPHFNIWIRSELDGSAQGQLNPPPDLVNWCTLTFSGRGTDPEQPDYVARLFVGKLNADAGTDIAIAQLDASGNVVGSEVSLSILLGQAQVGPALSDCCIRYSSLRNTLFLGVNTDINSSTPAMAWEIDLGLTTVINTYQGPNVAADRVNVAVNDHTGVLYMCGRELGSASGDLVALDTSGGSTTVYTTLINGVSYSAGDTRWGLPQGPIFRAGYPSRDDGTDTVLIPMNETGGSIPALEFYLDTTLHPVDGNGNLICRGSPLSMGRGWNGQQDEVTGHLLIATARGGYWILRKDDATRQFISGTWELYDMDSPPYGGPLPPDMDDLPPNPDRCAIADEYVKQLYLRQGTPPVTWSLQTLTGAVIDENTGLISGWTPGPDDAEQYFDFQVQASGVGTPDMYSWQVYVPALPQPNEYWYEMDVDLEDPSLLPPMVVHREQYPNDGYGDRAAGDFDPPESCGLRIENDLTVARFSDTGANGNDGFTLDHLPYQTFTVDMRVWGEENVVGYRSMSIQQTEGAVRGIQIEPGTGGGNSLHLDFIGADVVASFDFPATGAPDNYYRRIRLSVTGVDYQVAVYDLDRVDLNTGGWVLMGTFVLGGSGGPDAWLCVGPGITLNSLSHGSTSNSRWSADWIRLDVTKARDHLDPVIGGEAPHGCNVPFADADEDGDVDQDDFALFQLCFTGRDGGIPTGSEYTYGCVCFNLGDDDANGTPDQDDDIDAFDFQAFQNCATGPGIQWSQELTPLCVPSLPR